MLGDNWNWNDYERHQLRLKDDARREALEATARQQREQEAARREFISDAEKAIAAATAADVTSVQRMLVRHDADLVHEPPAVNVVFLPPGGAAQSLIGRQNARYVGKRRTIVTAPLIGEWEYATGLHELGHARANKTGDSRLRWEFDAWMWAMRHACVWDETAWHNMSDALRTYLASAEPRDVIEVHRIEGLLSEATFQAHRKPLAPALHAFEDAEFRSQHGHRYCGECRKPAVKQIDGWRWLCRPCFDRIEADRTIDQFRRTRTVVQQSRVRV